MKSLSSEIKYVKWNVDKLLIFDRRSRRLNLTILNSWVSSGVIGRAKVRNWSRCGVDVYIEQVSTQMKTVKIMGVLVLGFTLCWTPYYVMSIWWWAHKTSAEQLDFRLQKLLWAFACFELLTCSVKVYFFSVLNASRNRHWRLKTEEEIGFPPQTRFSIYV